MVWGFEIRVWSFEIRVWGFLIRVWGFEIRVWGFEIRVWGFEIRVWGFEIRVWGFEIRVWGFEIRVWVLKIRFEVSTKTNFEFFQNIFFARYVFRITFYKEYLLVYQVHYPYAFKKICLDNLVKWKTNLQRIRNQNNHFRCIFYFWWLYSMRKRLIFFSFRLW